jgi:DNA (cytosine-5)-methyltransferase 1
MIDNSTNKKDIKLLELFSGIGGFAKGLEQAGFNITSHQFSEIDKHAIANYKYNFKKSEYVGSVVDVSGAKADVITFGSPCQDFSLAGKRTGMDGERSVLILEAIRIISETKPSVFIWENVKGAFSSNDGADFWAILSAFANIGGYRLEWQLLNTSWFLPQNRERIYLVGHLAGRSEPGVFPITETDRGIAKGTAKAPVVRAITAGGHSGGHHSSMTLINQINPSIESGGTQPYQQNRVYDTDGIIPALNSELSGRNNIQVAAVLTPDRKEKRQNGRRFKEFGEPSFTLSTQDQHGVLINSGVNKGYEEANIGDTIDFQNPKSKTRKGRVSKDKTNTLDTACSQGILTDKTTIRRLTEVECERLQGFPDDWTKYGDYDGQIKEISKTQRYKLCGNAVTVDVVQAVSERLILKI